MTQSTGRPRQHAVDLDKLRSARRRDVRIGALALGALAGIVIGVPVALLVLFGWPLPRSLPTNQVLTQPLTAEIAFNILACLLWVAWPYVVFCLFVEWRAGRSGVGLTPRVPFAGAAQDLAGRLVGAALLLRTGPGAAPASTARVASPARQRPAVVATQQVASAPAWEDERARRPLHADAAGAKAPGRPVYTVMAPRGRYHDNLWDIAERHLGDGLRYKEIISLNQGKVFPDGRTLSETAMIQPGWQLIMPVDAVDLGPAVAADLPAAAVVPAAPMTPPSSAARDPSPAASVQPRGGAATGKPAPLAARQPTGSGAGSPTTGAAAPSPPYQPGDVPPPGAPQVAAPPRHAAIKAVGATQGALPVEAIGLWGLFSVELLAFGVMEALITKRRRQGQRREPGEALPRPSARAAALEVALRSRADGESARFLDRALRALAEAGPLPAACAARLTSHRLELLLDPARTDAPAPFVAEADGQVWAVAREAALPSNEYSLAPMPGLVTVGTDGDTGLLVDLAAAHGVVSLAGPEPQCRALLAAVAAELATNIWSDHVRVTIVGFGNELVSLAPDRVRCVEDVSDVLSEFESHAANAANALHDVGADAELSGWTRPPGGDDPTPDYVLLAQPPDADSLRRLTLLASDRHRRMGVLVAGGIAGARWTFQVDERGDLDTGPLGLRLRAAQLAEPAYTALAELLGTAILGEDDDSNRFDVDLLGPEAPVNGHLRPPGTPPRLVPDFPEDLDPDVPPLRLVRLLGPPDVFGGSDDDWPTPLLVEMIAYLASHRDGVSPQALTAAIWPRGSRAPEREAAMSQLTEWLGVDETGQPLLMLDGEGWLRLSAEVRLDWHQFAALVVRGQQADLRRALELVRGPIIDGASPGRYAWLSETALPYHAAPLIADTAHRLAAAYLGRGDPGGAANAARLGLRVDEGDEVLWRDLVRAEQSAGGIEAARAIARDMVATLQRLGGLDLVSAETSAVIRALLAPLAAQA